MMGFIFSALFFLNFLKMSVKKMNTVGGRKRLGNTIKVIRQKAANDLIFLDFIMAHNKVNQMNGEELKIFLGKKIEPIKLKIIHLDYKPIKNGIVIKSKKRNRRIILGDTSKFQLRSNFQNKIMPLLTEGETSQEVLRTDELLKRKRDSEIKAEMQISEISADQIAERIIQLRSKIKSWTIIGYCNGFVVDALPGGVGRLDVYAYELDDWSDGHRLLSCDKNLGS